MFAATAFTFSNAFAFSYVRFKRWRSTCSYAYPIPSVEANTGPYRSLASSGRCFASIFNLQLTMIILPLKLWYYPIIYSR